MDTRKANVAVVGISIVDFLGLIEQIPIRRCRPGVHSSDLSGRSRRHGFNRAVTPGSVGILRRADRE